MIKGLKLLTAVLIGSLVLAACARPAAAPTPTPTRAATPTPTVAATPTPTAVVRTPTATAMLTPTRAATPTPTATAMLTPTPTRVPAPTPTAAATPTPTAAATPTPPKLTPTAAPGGAQDLFLANCTACHGPKRQGIPNLGPALTPATLGSKSDADIKKTITSGRPGTLMPAWKDALSEADIDSLVKLLKYTEP